jgi:uncharacterized protein (DUF2249 family)
MSSAVLAHTNGSTSHTPTPWLQQSVQQFFGAFNWEDNPPEVQELKLAAAHDEQPLSLTLTVSQFFGAINWDGHAIGTVPNAAQQPPSTGTGIDAFTLDDFSDLF